jgi:hypothetical protein
MPVPSLVSPASCHLCLLAPPSLVSSRLCTHRVHTHAHAAYAHAAMEDRHANPRERARARANAHAAARTTSYAHHVRRSSRSIIS